MYIFSKIKFLKHFVIQSKYAHQVWNQIIKVGKVGGSIEKYLYMIKSK